MLLVSKAFITMAYNIAYLYGSEIFPTEVRNVGIGVAAVMEDVGAFVAPLVAGPLVFVLSQSVSAIAKRPKCTLTASLRQYDVVH